jgi:thioredoxin-related protein
MLDGMVADNGKHIEWMRDLNQAMKAAAEQHKPLVVIFEEDNCGWCKQFDKELTKPAAMQLGGDAIFIKIHPSRDVDGQALASNLGITGYPTVSILDFNGTNVSERSRTTGFISADQLAAQFGSGPSASNIQMA